MWLRGHNLSINFVLAFGAFGVQWQHFHKVNKYNWKYVAHTCFFSFFYFVACIRHWHLLLDYREASVSGLSWQSKQRRGDPPGRRWPNLLSRYAVATQQNTHSWPPLWHPWVLPCAPAVINVTLSPTNEEGIEFGRDWRSSFCPLACLEKPPVCSSPWLNGNIAIIGTRYAEQNIENSHLCLSWFTA
jgi:hypothetical protein